MITSVKSKNNKGIYPHQIMLIYQKDVNYSSFHEGLLNYQNNNNNNNNNNKTFIMHKFDKMFKCA